MVNDEKSGQGIVEKELTGRTIGVCMEVVNELGAGLLESVYQNR